MKRVDLMIKLFSAMTDGLFFGCVHFFIHGMSLKTICVS